MTDLAKCPFCNQELSGNSLIPSDKKLIDNYCKYTCFLFDNVDEEKMYRLFADIKRCLPQTEWQPFMDKFAILVAAEKIEYDEEMGEE